MPSRPRPHLRTLFVALLTFTVGATLAMAAPALAARDHDSPFHRLAGFVPKGDHVRVKPDAYAASRVDLGALRAGLPTGSATRQVAIMAPNGSLQRFTVQRTQLMEDELAAAHPEVTTYAGHGVDDPSATIALDLTPMGFHASVRGAGGQRAWYVDPAYNQRGTAIHLSYFGRDLPAAAQRRAEGETKAIRSAVEAKQAADRSAPGAPVERHFYRLALTSDPSYAAYFGSENVLAEKVTLINRVNQIYNDDLAVQLRLVNGTDKLNLDTAAKATGADGPCGGAPCFLPPTGGNDGELDSCDVPSLGKNRTVLGQLIGASNYDIGHLALGVNGGGIAYLGVVGGDYKGGGCTGLPDPIGDFYAIDYVAHEMGHQMGGDHTFNGALGACGGNIGEPAVEPGSGSSVMAYAGICGQDDLQAHTDPYFSFKTQDQVADVIADSYGNVEVQTVSLRGFAAGDSFTLGFGGATSTPITFANYNAATLKSTIEALTGEVVSIAQWGFDEFGYDPDVTQPDATGFQVIFNSEPSILAESDDIPEMTFASGTGVDGFVGETAQGGISHSEGIVVPSTNTNPTVTAPADKTIPLRTPFALTGSGTDADGEALTYLWEQTDFGNGVRLAQGNRVTGPLFRVFGKAADVTDDGTLQSPSPGENMADGNPTRVFPDLDQILAGNTNAKAACPAATTPTNQSLPPELLECYSELLPMAGYQGSVGNTGAPKMGFRLTARDGFVNGGGVAHDELTLTIDPSAGPFLVTSQGAAADLVGGSTVPVTWDVNNTQGLAPNVKISLSIDGGQTYGAVLAASTPNDGSENVTVPNTPADHVRIKVEAVDNYFFDLSDVDVRIVAGTPTTPPTTGPDTSAPDTSLLSGPAEGEFVLAKQVTLGYAASEPGVSYVCTLDGAAVACPEGSATVASSVGTHTFSVAAKDAAGNVDASPATRTWARPFDQSVLKAKKGWKTKKKAKAYGGSYLISKRAKAKLTTKVAGVRAVALVIGQQKKAGKAKVFLGKKKIGVVKFKGKKRFGVVVVVKRFAAPVSGKLRIVVKGKKPALIDGIGLLQ